MKNRTMKRPRFHAVWTALALWASGVGVASAQPGSGGGALPAPVFNPPVHFTTDVRFPFGLASADFLDANGNPGQDGYPEIAVAGAGVDLFEPEQTDCTYSPLDHYIRIYHNLGADPNFAWDTNPQNALEEVQVLNIGDADPEMWAMELAFADVTGINGPDLVLVGQDPNVPPSGSGFLVVYKNNGDGTFNSTPQVWHTTVPLEGLVVRDFDLDGDIDIIASSSNLHDDWFCSTSEQDAVVVFENTTQFPFNNLTFVVHPALDLGIPGDLAPGGIATDDFDALFPGQPLLDLVTPNPKSTSITQATNTGNLIFVPDTQNPPPGCDPNGQLVTAASNRFGADLNWDFASVHIFSDPNQPVYIDVFHGDGQGSFTNPCDEYTLQTPPNGGLTLMQAYGIDTGSIDNGPYPDIVAGTWGSSLNSRNAILDLIGIFLGKADGTFQMDTAAQKAYLLDNGTPGNIPANVMVVDLNADGFDDIVVADHLYKSDTLDTITVHINALSVSSGP